MDNLLKKGGGSDKTLDGIVSLSTGTIYLSSYEFVIITHAGWGTDNGGAGSHNCTVKVDGTTVMNHTVSHGSSASREYCGGQATYVVDNRDKSKTKVVITNTQSGSDIGGKTVVKGVKFQ